MELSERYIQTLEKEGYINIEERQDLPNEEHAERELASKITVFVTDGSLVFDIDGEKKEIKATERFNLSADKPYSLIAGPEGSIYIYGEKDMDDY